jgi:hypothetical protein
MATKIIHKKSSVAGSVPSAGDLTPGELAVNLADRIIYSKTTAGDVITMATPKVELEENKIFIGDSSNETTTAELKANLLTDVDTVTIEPEEAYVLTWNDTDEVWEPRAVPVSTNIALGSWSLGSSTAVGWSVGESGGKIVFRYGTTSAMTVDGSGNVVLDGTLYANNGTIGGTTDPDVTGTDWGYHDVGADFYFQYGSTNLMKLTSTGDLYVVGDVNANSTIAGTTTSSYYFRDGSGAQLEITTAGDLFVAGNMDA